MGSSRLSDETLTEFRKLSTPTLSDALDKLSINGAVNGLFLVTHADERVVGQSFTLLYMPVGIHGGNVGDYIHLVQPGDVVVIDNRGRMDCTVWGDILSAAAVQGGISGSVIEGVNRDLDEAVVKGYPIFSRGVFMRTGKDRVCLEAVNVAVVVGGVRVEPGDLVVGDASGVVIIPLAMVAKVLEVAKEIEKQEASILNDLEAGVSLNVAREKHGYHQLQRGLGVKS